MNLLFLEDPVAYAEFHFHQLGAELAKLSNDRDFRKLVYTEIDKKFDGDNNVLLETLSKELTSSNGRVAGALSGNEKFKTSLEAFKNIEGENYYPQIYIPFYEELSEESTSSNGRIMSVENDPLFVFFTGDNSEDIYPAYQWDEASEELIKTDILVDEEYALTHEVWVISINERMDPADGSIMDESNLTNARTQSTPSAYVDQIKCKCHKESWAAGRSEVHMLLLVSDWGFENGDLHTYGKGPYEGGQIYKFKRKDVRKKRNKDVNFLILNNWDDRAPGMPYVIM